jgi:hypothetical protein
MGTNLDADPDPLVSALQTADAHLIAARLELRPVLLICEQRQRMRERARLAKAAKSRANGSSAAPHEDDAA